MNQDKIRELVRRTQPHLIINAAAYNAVDRAESERDLAMAINAAAPGILAEEAKRVGAGFIHFSTDYVFSGKGNRPWRENDRPSPINVYGASKLAGEHAVRQVGGPHFIFRLSWLYGTHGSNFVKTILDLGIHRETLRVVSDQVGAPTSARFVAHCVAQILTRAKGDWTSLFRKKGDVYHLTCAGEVSRYGCAKEIFRLARRRGAKLRLKSLIPILSADYETRAPRPPNCRLDCRRVRRIFGLRLFPWGKALALSFTELLASERINL